MDVAARSQEFARAYALDRLQQALREAGWVHAIAIVDFDLREGQTLQLIWPVDALKRERSALAKQAFPDSNATSLGDTVFVTRFPRADGSATFNAFVCFRQERDDSLPRGHFQQAFVLVSELLRPQVLLPTVAAIGRGFFPLRHDAQAANAFLASALSQISTWSSESSAESSGETLSLPLLGTVICTEAVGETAAWQYTPTTEADDHRSDDHRSDGASAASDQTHVRHHEPSDREIEFLQVPFSRVLSRARPIQMEVGNGRGDVFCDLTGMLWHLWQLALLGRSVCFFASDTGSASCAVLSFLSLVSPLQCGELSRFGTMDVDVRPSLSVFDPCFRELTRSCGSETRSASRTSSVSSGSTRVSGQSDHVSDHRSDHVSDRICDHVSDHLSDHVSGPSDHSGEAEHVSRRGVVCGATNLFVLRELARADFPTVVTLPVGATGHVRIRSRAALDQYLSRSKQGRQGQTSHVSPAQLFHASRAERFFVRANTTVLSQLFCTRSDSDSGSEVAHDSRDGYRDGYRDGSKDGSMDDYRDGSRDGYRDGFFDEHRVLNRHMLRQHMHRLTVSFLALFDCFVTPPETVPNPYLRRYTRLPPLTKGAVAAVIARLPKAALERFEFECFGASLSKRRQNLRRMAGAFVGSTSARKLLVPRRAAAQCALDVLTRDAIVECTITRLVKQAGGDEIFEMYEEVRSRANHAQEPLLTILKAHRSVVEEHLPRHAQQHFVQRAKSASPVFARPMQTVSATFSSWLGLERRRLHSMSPSHQSSQSGGRGTRSVGSSRRVSPTNNNNSNNNNSNSNSNNNNSNIRNNSRSDERHLEHHSQQRAAAAVGIVINDESHFS